MTTQAPVPVQPENVADPAALNQPSNVSPDCAVAVRVTDRPESYVVQSLPKTEQLEVTEPTATDRATLLELRAGLSYVTVKSNVWTNVAVTEVVPVTVTTQVPVPLQPPPDHPEKR